MQPASLYLIPYKAQLKTLCDAKEREKHNTDSEGDIKATSISVQPWTTHKKKSHYTVLYAGANLE